MFVVTQTVRQELVLLREQRDSYDDRIQRLQWDLAGTNGVVTADETVRVDVDWAGPELRVDCYGCSMCFQACVEGGVAASFVLVASRLCREGERVRCTRGGSGGTHLRGLSLFLHQCSSKARMTAAQPHPCISSPTARPAKCQPTSWSLWHSTCARLCPPS